MACMNFILRVV